MCLRYESLDCVLRIKQLKSKFQLLGWIHYHTAWCVSCGLLPVIFPYHWMLSPGHWGNQYICSKPIADSKVILDMQIAYVFIRERWGNGFFIFSIVWGFSLFYGKYAPWVGRKHHIVLSIRFGNWCISTLEWGTCSRSVTFSQNHITICGTLVLVKSWVCGNVKSFTHECF